MSVTFYDLPQIFAHVGLADHGLRGERGELDTWVMMTKMPHWSWSSCWSSVIMTAKKKLITWTRCTRMVLATGSAPWFRTCSCVASSRRGTSPSATCQHPFSGSSSSSLGRKRKIPWTWSHPSSDMHCTCLGGARVTAAQCAGPLLASSSSPSPSSSPSLPSSSAPSSSSSSCQSSSCSSCPSSSWPSVAAGRTPRPWGRHWRSRSATMTSSPR